MKTNWYRHGIWNSLEHLLSRGLDALATIALLWFISTETFSLLALSQAYVAPILVLFLSPETALYPKFAEWSAEGDARMANRLRILRKFAWGKIAVAIALSAVVALVFKTPTGTAFGYEDRFSSLIWAFSLPLASQVSGADREYLRISLRLEVLNLLTLLQRTIYLSGLLISAMAFNGSFRSLALAGVITVVGTAWLARRQAEATFDSESDEASPGVQFWSLIRESLRDFSIWNHISGVILGWAQTLDLFFLGIFGAPARVIGTYSVVLKIANFALALPVSLANLYLVRLGRVGVGRQEDEKAESRQLVKMSALLAICSFGGALLIWALAPYGVSLLSQSRWTEPEQARMVGWLAAILPASALYASLLLWTGWLSIRRSFKNLVFKVYIPWSLSATAIYAFAIWRGGADWGAPANLVVFGLLVPFLLGFTRRNQ